ncbi:hypothetical protein SALBM311S_03553 [Streptomyces alboniger]
MEAPLHPHHPIDPSRPTSPDPVYWVTPRHLAGDDGVLAERIGDTLTELGWRMWPTSRNTLLYVSPDGLRGAEWVLAAYPFELGGLPVAWQLSARPYPASVLTEWNAYFTGGGKVPDHSPRWSAHRPQRPRRDPRRERGRDHHAHCSGAGRPRTRYRYNYAIFSTSGFRPEAQDYALAHQISLIDLSAQDFAVLRNLVKTTADTIHAVLEVTPAAERPKVHEIRTYLRGPLLDMDAGDADLPDAIRGPLDYLAQALHSRSQLGLVLAFPAAPFVLGLASDDLYAFVDYARAHPTHAVRLRRINQAASHPVWELRSAEHPEAYALRFGLPERVEAWIVEQDEGMPSRTRYIKRSMLSTMTLYWMDGEHAQTFQLRYEPGELRLDG